MYLLINVLVGKDIWNWMPSVVRSNATLENADFAHHLCFAVLQRGWCPFGCRFGKWGEDRISMDGQNSMRTFDRDSLDS